ncbi:MAG: hypothetical protein M3256_26515 [Actinomycetota bacterium]|nr:hypothetical protein [Actinomycetota bacterium]
MSAGLVVVGWAMVVFWVANLPTTVTSGGDVRLAGGGLAAAVPFALALVLSTILLCRKKSGPTIAATIAASGSCLVAGYLTLSIAIGLVAAD